MSLALANPSPRPATDLGRLFLAASFFAFCYGLLTWRALLLNDAAPLFSDRRALALLVGAGVFWLALGQLEKPGRLTLVRTASWIVLGTIAVMVARLAVNWWKPDAMLTLGYSLRWSLAWAAYFGLWLMGAITFRVRAALAESAAAAAARPTPTGVDQDAAEWVVQCLANELAGASATDRATLAERLIRSAGSYEMADDASGEGAAHNARVQLAYRVAERLTAERR